MASHRSICESQPHPDTKFGDITGDLGTTEAMGPWVSWRTVRVAFVCDCAPYPHYARTLVVEGNQKPLDDLELRAHR